MSIRLLINQYYTTIGLPIIHPFGEWFSTHTHGPAVHYAALIS